MAQRIVYVFEMIQVQKDHCNRSVLAASQGNRLRDPVVEQKAIGQVGNNIVPRGMRHLERHGPRRAHIMEYNHRSDDAAYPVMDRRGGIFNSGFKSVASEEDAIYSQPHCPILLDGHLQGVSSGLARGTVNNSKDLGERVASGFFRLA